MKKQFSIIVTTLLISLFFIPSAFAHVVVKPSEAGIGAYQTFTISVPNEKDNPTIGLRLVIPNGLESVTPNVKPGWTIDTKKVGDREDANVAEITWTNGSIPPEQRDEFVFSAQVPAKETTLQWKAYQTYEDGTVVTWDQKPTKEEKEDETKGPYSQTQVIDDLKATNDMKTKEEEETKQNTETMQLSFAALALAAFAIALQLKKK